MVSAFPTRTPVESALPTRSAVGVDEQGNMIIDVVGEPRATLTSYNPTWAEKAEQKLSELLMSMGMGRIEALNLGRSLTGFLNDLTPVGNAFGVADADSDIERQLSMLPLPGPARRVVGEAIKGIRAFHGSPHDFDKFDLSKIGTGEGAQAYGHGLYFAENEAVAREYQRVLSGERGWTFRDKVDLTPDELQNEVNAAYGGDFLDNVMRPGGVADAVMDNLKSGGSTIPWKPESERGKLAATLMSEIKHAHPGGRMYEVNINADPDSLLDWDAPLAPDLSKEITKLGAGTPELRDGMALAGGGNLRITPTTDGDPRYFLEMGDNSFRLTPNDVRNLVGSGIEGRSAYQSLASNLGGDRAASARLREAGIPGIKYFDQGSRTAGQGSRNFVVFDDSLVDILRKY